MKHLCTLSNRLKTLYLNMVTLGFIAAVVTLNFKLCFSACPHAEYEVNGECCPMCAPGNCVHWHCTADTSTTCAPCPALTYTDEPNGFEMCFPCSVCDASNGLRVKRTCTHSADTVCEPLKGFYCFEQNKDSCRFAMGHSQCNPGQYIKQTGTASTDTVCGNCMEGTYSNGSFTACQPHSMCETEGLKETKPGTVSFDAECGNLVPVGVIVGAIVVVFILVTSIGIYLILKHKRQTSETDTNNCRVSVQESILMESQCDSEPTSTVTLIPNSKKTCKDRASVQGVF